MNTAHRIAGRFEALTFFLGREEYALAILAVREIRGHSRAVALAGTPDFLKGTLQLQGRDVPIIGQCQVGSRLLTLVDTDRMLADAGFLPA